MCSLIGCDRWQPSRKNQGVPCWLWRPQSGIDIRARNQRPSEYPVHLAPRFLIVGITSLASSSIDRMILPCGVVYICMNSSASSTPASASYSSPLPHVWGLPMQAPPALTISDTGTDCDALYIVSCQYFMNHS